MTNTTNTITDDVIQNVVATAGELLANAGKSNDRSDDAKEKAKTLRAEAATHIYPIVDDILGYDEDSRVQFDGREANRQPDYADLKERILLEICALRKLNVEYRGKNNDVPVIPKKVSKEWSRLMVSYREGGEGGQTDADKQGREAAKQRKQTNDQMAGVLFSILSAHREGDEAAVATALTAADARFPATLTEHLA